LQECVICGTVYVSENDSSGWKRLVPVNRSVSEQVQKDTPPFSSSSLEPVTSASRNKGEAVAGNDVRQVAEITEFLVLCIQYLVRSQVMPYPRQLKYVNSRTVLY
jgi:hypothetical protein